MLDRWHSNISNLKFPLWRFNWSLVFLTTFIMPRGQAVVIIILSNYFSSRPLPSVRRAVTPKLKISQEIQVDKKLLELDFKEDLWRLNITICGFTLSIFNMTEKITKISCLSCASTLLLGLAGFTLFVFNDIHFDNENKNSRNSMDPDQES